ncbi:MAG TPA: regulatory protein RecX [Candidatus Binatia bacterium]|nr:regulatory protein RecX [Candidatus Binatia bacterium]
MTDTSSETYTKAYNQAIKYLSMRSHTVFELRNKLLRKNFEKNIIAQVLKDLVETKYLNDRDFAHTFVQNLIKYKTFGYYGIKMKLRQRGISDEIAEDVLGEELDHETEKKIAEKAISKSGKKDKEKLMMMLKRKGFRSIKIEMEE